MAKQKRTFINFFLFIFALSKDSDIMHFRFYV